jgi:hypothetical protein
MGRARKFESGRSRPIETARKVPPVWLIEAAYDSLKLRRPMSQRTFIKACFRDLKVKRTTVEVR